MKAGEEHDAKVTQYAALLTRLGARVHEQRSGKVGRLYRVQISHDATPARGWQTSQGHISCGVMVEGNSTRNVAEYVDFLKPEQITFL